MVSPALISRESQLSSVDDVFNGILVRGDATGDVVFYGKGAGKLPTASAVIADIVDAVKATSTSKSLSWKDDGKNHVLDYQRQKGSFYLRMQGDGIQKARELFGDIRLLHRDRQPEDEFAFATPAMTEEEMEQKSALLEQSGSRRLAMLRILDY